MDYARSVKGYFLLRSERMSELDCTLSNGAKKGFSAINNSFGQRPMIYTCKYSEASLERMLRDCAKTCHKVKVKLIYCQQRNIFRNFHGIVAYFMASAL